MGQSFKLVWEAEALMIYSEGDYSVLLSYSDPHLGLTYAFCSFIFWLEHCLSLFYLAGVYMLSSGLWVNSILPVPEALVLEIGLLCQSMRNLIMN